MEHVRKDPSPETAEAALTRTVLLLRDHVRDDVSDEELTAILTSGRVAVTIDRLNAASPDAQTALITTALLAARCGIAVDVQVPDDVLLRGVQPPLTGTHLGAALSDTLDDLIPGVTVQNARASRPDLVITIGDSPVRERGARQVALSGDAWAGAIGPIGARWNEKDSPFGALAAAGIAGGEAYKAAVARMRHHARDPREFDDLFAPTYTGTVQLAPTGFPLPTADLGEFDCISGGAIIQSAVFGLVRIPRVSGYARVVEPDVLELSNLNRYALARRSRMGAGKVEELRRLADAGALGGVAITAIPARYDHALATRLELGTSVLVGVDDIPSRWLVQQHAPHWVGVGATSHYLSMASYHRPGLACAQCVHPVDDPGNAPIPTLSLVSHWAGLWLAVLFARERAGLPAPVSEQVVYISGLRTDSPAAIWRGPTPRLPHCPLHREHAA